MNRGRPRRNKWGCDPYMPASHTPTQELLRAADPFCHYAPRHHRDVFHRSGGVRRHLVYGPRHQPLPECRVPGRSRDRGLPRRVARRDGEAGRQADRRPARRHGEPRPAIGNRARRLHGHHRALQARHRSQLRVGRRATARRYRARLHASGSHAADGTEV